MSREEAYKVTNTLPGEDPKFDSIGGNETKPTLAQDEPEPSTSSRLIGVCILVLCLGFQGFALERSRVWLPQVIFDQMLFRNWIVMKVFMGAMGSSMLAQAVLSALRPETFDSTRYYAAKRIPVARIAAGTFILGIGMSVAGTGPTMLPAYAGGGLWTIGPILGGAALGIAVFGLLDTFLPIPKPTEDNPVLEGFLSRFEPLKGSTYLNYRCLSVLIGSLMLICCIVLEILAPFDNESAKYKMSAGWAPSIAGIVTGLNQIPIRLITGDGQGGATSLTCIVSTLTCGLIPSIKPLVLTKWANWWQVICVWFGLFPGSLIASNIFGEFNDPVVHQFEWYRGFIGGFLMLFGARLAMGCTCGHGISGTSELALSSFLGAGCIFGGAILTAVIINAAS
eukprot:NODE_555_length_1372_cov_9.175100_g519_i0.p1 GENE.NODE_555_length_1372_cov_9.175100_g519_i0~~NODE_555_length_1372_cov_9.175100_g519_i0.p1  ORF type:complete len:395 (+),score=36.19 NODE_555_length_1372_cov_9.175100_g519_i0:110-1294(+)